VDIVLVEFQLRLNLDWVMLHMLLSTSTCMPNFIEIKETIVDRRTHVYTHGRTFETGFILQVQ